MAVRPANLDEIDALIGIARRFHDASGYADIAPFSEDAAREFGQAMIQADTAVVLVTDNGGAPNGMLVGSLTAVPCSADVLVAAEVMWWVDEDARQGRAGIELLRAFETWAFEHGAAIVQMMSLSKMGNTALADLYQRRGYRMVEQSWIRVLSGA